MGSQISTGRFQPKSSFFQYELMLKHKQPDDRIPPRQLKKIERSLAAKVPQEVLRMNMTDFFEKTYSRKSFDNLQLTAN